MSAVSLAGGLLTEAVLAALLAWLALLAWHAAIRYRHFRRLELALPGPVSQPLLGNVLAFASVDERNAFNIMLGLWGGRAGLCRFSMFNRLFVFATDPDDIERIVKDKRFHEKPAFMYGALSEVLGDGLLTLRGRRWLQHRGVMLPTFHVAVLERFLDVFAEEADAMVERIEPRSRSGEAVDVAAELRQTAARSALRTSMSSRLTPADEPELQAIIEGLAMCLNAVNMRSFRPWLWPRATFRWTSLASQLDAFNARTEAFVSRIIEQRTRELLDQRARSLEEEADKSRRKSFIDLMLEAKLDGRVDLTEREIIDESKTLIAASLETSVTEMSFTFKMLSIFPDVQERVLAELDLVFGVSGGPGSERQIVPEDLPRLEYLERVIKETMRLFPSSALVARDVAAETTLVGRTLPAGTTLILNIFGLHRDPRHWPDPLRFDPDRFLPEPTAARHPLSYMPFSAGTRSCIGQRYAMMQMKAVLAATLRRYRVLPGPDGWTQPDQFPLNFEIVLRLLGGFHVVFESRARPRAA